MKTLTAYLDRARNRAGLKSDRQLSLALGHTGPTVWRYRGGRDFPDDETMIKLAELGELPIDKAIIDLNIWRAKSPVVKQLYTRIAATIMVAFFIVLINGNAKATVSTPSLHTVYYGCFRRRFKRLFPLIYYVVEVLTSFTLLGSHSSNQPSLTK